MKERKKAAILALIVGSFGVHRFYLGQFRIGILYILFCWTLLPTAKGIVDFIFFLIMSDEKFDLKYSLVNDYNTTQKKYLTNELVRLERLMKKGTISLPEFKIKRVKLLYGFSE